MFPVTRMVSRFSCSRLLHSLSHIPGLHRLMVETLGINWLNRHAVARSEPRPTKRMPTFFTGEADSSYVVCSVSYLTTKCLQRSTHSAAKALQLGHLRHTKP